MDEICDNCGQPCIIIGCFHGSEVCQECMDILKDTEFEDYDDE